jgi:uncharacterized protein (DUF1501 family)
MSLTRRSFLQTTALGLSAATPSVLLRAAEDVAGLSDDQVLVVVQLSGGNDGLNTVIPFESDAYHRNRPTLAVSKGSVLKLDKRAPLDVGLHPAMTAMKELYDEGHVAVVQGIGYPNPSRSHFRSMDIWHTARPGDLEASKGWLGRSLELGGRSLNALQIGGEKLPLALHGQRHVASLQNLDFLDFLATKKGKEMRRMMTALLAPSREGAVESVRGLAETTLVSLEKIVKVREKPVPVEYPDSRLSERLKWAGQMIGGGYPSRIFYVSQGGYDTHAQQRDGHQVLLQRLSDAVGAFHRHMEKIDATKRVTVVVFSEFGRRVKENGSLGTDHGCAAPAFVISGRVKGGLHGKHPSLTDLDHGDLKYGVDFRRLYATVLEDVLKLKSEKVLGGKFEKLDLLG